MGVDPLSTETAIREISITITNLQSNTLNGSLGIEYLGSISYFSLLSPTNFSCLTVLQAVVDGVNSCNYTIISAHKHKATITFSYGNPTISDFFCDSSLATEGVECIFSDIVVTGVPGNYLCLI